MEQHKLSGGSRKNRLETATKKLNQLFRGDGSYALCTDIHVLAVPLRLRAGGGVLSFISTTTVFGTAVDVTLSEVTVESFFPADEATRNALGAGQG